MKGLYKLGGGDLNIFMFTPIWGRWSNLTYIFEPPTIRPCDVWFRQGPCALAKRMMICERSFWGKCTWSGPKGCYRICGDPGCHNLKWVWRKSSFVARLWLNHGSFPMQQWEISMPGVICCPSGTSTKWQAERLPLSLASTPSRSGPPYTYCLHCRVGPPYCARARFQWWIAAILGSSMLGTPFQLLSRTCHISDAARWRLYRLVGFDCSVSFS